MNFLLAVENSQVISRWQSLLAGQDCLAHAASAAEVKSQLAKQSFDLVLLHRSLVELASIAEIRSLYPACRLFLLSDDPQHEEGLAFLKAGIVGYGNTYISAELLKDAVHIITSGGVWLGQKVIHQLILELHRNANEAAIEDLLEKLSLLTRMERRVAELVAKGETNLKIAADLEISERTVKAHLTSIYEKLHVGNRLSLALLMNQGGGR